MLNKVLSQVDSHAVALRCGKSRCWTYSDLVDSIETLVGELKEYGVRPGHRLAIAMPGGPDCAIAIMAASDAAIALPINPKTPQVETTQLLRNLEVDLLVVLTGAETPARHSATSLGIPILETSSGLNPDSKAPRDFEQNAIRRISNNPATGLLLTTSGSTGKRKRVLLSQENLCRSATSVARSLDLSSGDTGLCLMPLYHVHGLVAGLLGGLHAGGCVICPAGLVGDTVTEWFRNFSPTWYTASPIIHRSVVDRMSDNPVTLRVVRSCSSPMPTALLSQIESVFQCPVIEAYGMTEASHQIASNPMPPGRRKPGSVGVVTDTEVAIRGENGLPLAPGEVGEITIRGQNVIRAYHEEASGDEQFYGDWLRTGDEGFLDDDGYLFITGRIKEVINRGGEKVRPLEIDHALSTHPDVEVAMAFGVPHPTLGEDVAAVIVPSKHHVLDEQEMRKYAFEYLAPSKVPTRIFFVDKFPDDGIKPRRLELAEKMSHLLFTEYAAPVTNTEQVVADIYAQVLNIERVGRLDNFFSLGGDSLQATLVQSRLTQRFQIKLKVGRLFEKPSVAELAALIDDQIPYQHAELTAALLDELDGMSEDEILTELESAKL